MTMQNPFEVTPPPHNLDAEQELLGAILCNNAALPRIRPYLQADDFYHPAHRSIYEAILSLVDAGDIANPVTLNVYFADDPVLKTAGGVAYLARLAGAATTVYNAAEYAAVIADCSLRRRLMAAGDGLRMRAASPALDLPAAQILADHQHELTQWANAGRKADLTNQDVTAQILSDLETPVRPMSTGFPNLDDATCGGLYPGKLYGIAARKKVGKTTILSSISYNLIAQGHKHQFFACEASPKEVQQSMIARYGGFNRMAFLPDGRDKSWVKTKAALYQRHAKPSLIWHDAPGITFSQLQTKTLAGIAAGAKGTIIDYWQVVTGKGAKESEEYHLRSVAQWCADTARKTGTWFLMAAQINQEGNTRGGEGLKLACDQYYQLHREKRDPGAWMQMEETRYTPYKDVGDDTVPGLYMSAKIGPCFVSPQEWSPDHDNVAD